jgi:hypothetical protein
MAERATYAAIVGAFFANMAKDRIVDYFWGVAIPPGGPIRVARAKINFLLVCRVGIVCFFDNSDFI